MSTSLTSRLSAVCAALGFLLLAGSARAQFEECVLPTDVPEAVFNTIEEQASFDFGDVSEKACNAIVKEGIKACKAQVKGADKCYKRAFDTNYSIALKQCNELATKEERSACKAGFKENRDNQRTEIDISTGNALAVCEGDFAEALSDACLGVLKM